VGLLVSSNISYFCCLGGTTDITVHEVTGPDILKEIHQACGGHYGGNTVNQEFFKFLERLLSGPVIQEIRTIQYLVMLQ
jgi:hypothetical protein